MIPTHKRLIKRALDDGFSVSVYDGQEWAAKRSTNYREIIAVIESVDDSWVTLRRGEEIVKVYIVLDYGEEDTVNDHTVCPYMDSLAEEGVI